MPVCEILSVGSELTLGNIVDTNSSFLAKEIRKLGYTVRFCQTVSDDRDDMIAAFQTALDRSDLILATGGLGPTYDDRTREVVSELLGKKLILSEPVKERIRLYFTARQMPMSDNNLRQAMVPEGAKVLQNDWGTAPGLYIEEKGKEIFLLPGVPREMKELFCNRVYPLLAKKSRSTVQTRILRFYGIGESLLEERLGDLMKNSIDPNLATFALSGEVALHITAHGKSAEKVRALIAQSEREILDKVGEYCYGAEQDCLESVLVKRFAERGLTIAAAESCTGGLVSQRITSVSGSSAVFRLGVCSYCEEMKEKVLNVSEKLLREDRVYSEECALQMARGVLRLAESDIAIGITGIAGPDGGTETDPVGTVYIAVTNGQKECVVRNCFSFTGNNREYIRTLASSKALAMALELCDLFRHRDCF